MSRRLHAERTERAAGGSRHQKKLEKRAAQKARKKADRAERLAAGDSDQPQEKRQKVDKPPRIGGRGSHNRERFDVARKQGKRVCIDLSFDDMMTEKEVKSLVIQVRAARPPPALPRHISRLTRSGGESGSWGTRMAQTASQRAR
eukprot:3651418-Rhodomonas_salina.3